MARRAMASAEPDRIGRYEVLGRIAQGGMAEIYLARQPGIGGFSRRVVLKCIIPVLAEEPRFVKMFMEESRLASQIHHPNVVQIFDVGEEDDTYFIAMEYIDGLAVGSMVTDEEGEQRALPLDVAGEIVLQACAGLHAAHKLTDEEGRPLGLVHRDISPQNLMVSTDGVVKLVDFGIAKAQDSSVTTRTGNIKGKYAYMSPEQVRGRPLDRRSDLFSLGTVLFELLTGKQLFHRNAELAILVAIIEEDYPLAHEVNSEVPEEVSEILSKALERDREDRFATAAEMGTALREVLGRLGHYTSSEILANYLETDCRDQIKSRKVEQVGLGTPASAIEPSASLFDDGIDPDSVVDAESTDAISPSQIPDIIDLPPPRVEPDVEPDEEPDEEPGDDSLDEPTIQSMEPLEDDREIWVDEVRAGPLPEPDFDEDEALGLAVAPTGLLNSTEPEEEERGIFDEATTTVKPQSELEAAVDERRGPPRVDSSEELVENPPQGGRWVEFSGSSNSLGLPAAPPAPRILEPMKAEAPLELDVPPSSPPDGPEAPPAEAATPSAADDDPPPEPPLAPENKKGRGVPLTPIVAAIVVVLAMVGGAAWYFTRPGGRPAGEPLAYAHPPSYRPDTLQKGLGPLAGYLERRMNRPVKITTTGDYQTLVDDLLSGQVQFANLPALLYVLARDRDPDLEAMALSAFEGSSTDQSYIIARDDSGIRSVDQLKGKRFCHPDPLSTSGYLIPRQFLRTKGFDPDEDFAKVSFSEGHVGVMEDIVEGRCDAGAVISSAWLSARDLRIKGSKIRLVTVAGDVMRDVVCASPKLPASLTASLRKALLRFEPQRDLGAASVSPLFPIDRFVAVRPDAFNPIEKAARAEGLID